MEDQKWCGNSQVLETGGFGNGDCRRKKSSKFANFRNACENPVELGVLRKFATRILQWLSEILQGL